MSAKGLTWEKGREPDSGEKTVDRGKNRLPLTT